MPRTWEPGSSRPLTTKYLGREVQVNPHITFDMGPQSNPPAGMLRFIETPVAQGFVQARNVGLLASLATGIIVWVILLMLSADRTVSLTIGASLMALNAMVVKARYRSHATTPLAVNMNHPFLDENPLSDAEVRVQLTDGRWVDTGEHRVRLAPDELLGGYNLVHDTLDYPVLGHFTSQKERTPTIVRHLALINQAIALRNAVNSVPDPIDEARDREGLDSGLLERSWLEDEGEIEVESPLVSFFRKEE